MQRHRPCLARLIAERDRFGSQPGESGKNDLGMTTESEKTMDYIILLIATAACIAWAWVACDEIGRG